MREDDHTAPQIDDDDDELLPWERPAPVIEGRARCIGASPSHAWRRSPVRLPHRTPLDRGDEERAR
jgi:hypothetical protein